MTGPAIRVAFIGLGTMGTPMAMSLRRAGFPLAVFDRRPDVLKPVKAAGADVASTAAGAASGVDVLITMLPGAGDVIDVLFGSGGAAAALRPGATVIDMSTISPGHARTIAGQLAAAGVAFLDGPVSGGPARAADGSLSIMVGGDPGTLEKVRPVLLAMGQRIFHVGDVGAGQVAKACNNLLVGVIMIANVEALALGAASGVDSGALREIILASSGGNWQLEHVVPQTLLTESPAPMFGLALLHKDLGIAGEMAAEVRLPLFLGSLARQLYELAWDRNGGMPDFTRVADVYLERADSTISLLPRRGAK